MSAPSETNRESEIENRKFQVLLIKPGSMGDVIHAIPAAAAIKAHWPDCCLTWLVDSRWAELLRGNPDVDELLIFPREKFRGLFGWVRGAWWALKLSHLRPDLVVDLQGLLRSALFARLSGGKRIVGGSDAREGALSFYHETAKVDATKHAVDRYFQILTGAGIPRPGTLHWRMPAGRLPAFGNPKEKSKSNQLPERFVLLHPFARGKNKSLTGEQVRFLANALQPLTVVLAGRYDGAVNDLPVNVTDLLEKTTLPELMALIRTAAYVVSVDSGPAHLAAAMARPLVSIHTWSDPLWVGPYSPKAWVWFKGDFHRAGEPGEVLTVGTEVTNSGLLQIAEHVRRELGVEPC